MHNGQTIKDLIAMADRALASGNMPQCEYQFVLDLAAEIERQKIARNNEVAMKGLDAHFEYRGGAFDERDRYDS